MALFCVVLLQLYGQFLEDSWDTWVHIPWRRHQMETFSALTALCEGNPHGQWCRALMFSLICTWNKRLNKQSRLRWFETPSRSLWRHGNVSQVYEIYAGPFYWVLQILYPGLVYDKIIASLVSAGCNYSSMRFWLNRCWSCVKRAMDE